MSRSRCTLGCGLVLARGTLYSINVQILGGKGRGDATSCHITMVRFDICLIFLSVIIIMLCLQCFDIVGWAAGRASGL